MGPGQSDGEALKAIGAELFPLDLTRGPPEWFLFPP